MLRAYMYIPRPSGTRPSVVLLWLLQLVPAEAAGWAASVPSPVARPPAPRPPRGCWSATLPEERTFSSLSRALPGLKEREREGGTSHGTVPNNCKKCKLTEPSTHLLVSHNCMYESKNLELFGARGNCWILISAHQTKGSKVAVVAVRNAFLNCY